MIDYFWQQNFGTCPPIAHLLRDRFCERWTRFHSLPASKRYAESEVEWGTILERHNTVMAGLAKGKQPIQLELLTTGNGSQSPIHAGPPDALADLRIGSSFWLSVPMHIVEGDADDFDPMYWHVYRSPLTWKSDIFDQLVRAIADGELFNVMLFDPTDTWLLHPYDGGMDLLLSTRAEKEHWGGVHPSWKSPRSDGL